MAPEVPAMSQRIVAQSTIVELLRRQQALPPQSRAARLFGLSPLARDARRWFAKAQAEVKVGAILAGLSADWMIFHALPLGTPGYGVDHVLVGPAGLLTIDTVSRRSRNVVIEGATIVLSHRATTHLRDAEMQAAGVTELVRRRIPLLVPAQPVVTLVGPREITFYGRAKKVTVTDSQHLVHEIEQLGPVLYPAEVSQLASVIDDPETWGVVPPATAGPRDGEMPVPGELAASFASIESDVRSAGQRRLWWVLVAVIVAAVIAFAVILAVGEGVLT